MRMGYAHLTIVKQDCEKEKVEFRLIRPPKRRPEGLTAEADPDGTRQRHYEAQWIVKTIARDRGALECAETFSLRKEVIQPQVLLRLPCYDFTPIMNYTLGGCSSCELAHRLLVQPTFVM